MRELTTTSYAILGLLCIRTWSAYELAKQMQRSLRFVWPRAVSGVYQEPKNLVAHGLAAATAERTGRRRRTLYAATPKGRQAFRRWLSQPSAFSQFESEALVRVMLAEHGTKDDLLATLRGLREEADALERHGASLVAEYLTTGGPFPRRLHLIALGTRFVGDYVNMLREWATWAELQVSSWDDVKPLTDVSGAVALYRAILGEERLAGIERLNGDSPGVETGGSVEEDASAQGNDATVNPTRARRRSVPRESSGREQ